MGKGSKQQAPAPTSQEIHQSALPEYAKPYYTDIMQRAQAESNRPYQDYGQDRIAGFNPQQTATQQEVAGMQARPEFDQAAQFAQTGGTQALGFGQTASGLGAIAAGAGQQYQNQATSPAAQQAFMSPYMQNVVDIQKQEAVRDAQINNLSGNLGAARQGTYGGARQLLAQTERDRNLQQQLGSIQAEGQQNAFQQAQQAQQFGANLGMQGFQTGIQGQQAGMQGAQQATSAGATIGDIGQSAQANQLQRIQAQAAAGQEQRGLSQQLLDSSYADFLAQRDYPMEQLGYFSNLMRGIPVGLGSTATTYAQPPSMASQLTGAGIAGLGMYNLAK
tara:strand:- start:14 stop:1012 length:999 start_codon:yes stop_codon:yes gene_type:complete